MVPWPCSPAAVLPGVAFLRWRRPRRTMRRLAFLSQIFVSISYLPYLHSNPHHVETDFDFASSTQQHLQDIRHATPPPRPPPGFEHIARDALPSRRPQMKEQHPKKPVLYDESADTTVKSPPTPTGLPVTSFLW